MANIKDPDSRCPLLTPYALSIGLRESTLEKLWSVRQHDPLEGPVSINVGPWLRDTVKLKNFQTQSIAHLMLVPRILIGDAVGLGKTLTSIGGMCYHRHKNPNLKILVVTTKSMSRQFTKEIIRFSKLETHIIKDSWEGKTSHESRMLQVDHWLSKDGPDVLIAKYGSLIGKRKSFKGEKRAVDDNGNPLGKDGKELVSQEVIDLRNKLWPHRENLLIIFDECHKLKNEQATTRVSMMQIQQCAIRCWGLSASLIKNGADEIYAVMSAIGIRPHGSLEDFRDRFCVYEMTKINKYKWVPRLTGYQRMDEFKTSIRPFVYARSQRQVKEPLPRLETKFYEVELDDRQYKLLTRDIPEGIYQLPPGIRKVAGELALVDRDPGNLMTMLSVYQLVANHPNLLEAFDEKKLFSPSLSPKEEALLDLLDGELAGEKVIVFTKYKTWINRLEHLIKQQGMRGRKFLRITGNENEKQREDAMTKFQESPEYNLIVINTAAMEGINLQESAHMICLDLPWSWGDLIQLVGRMLRLASPHSACTLHCLVAKGTVDEYVIATLLGKKGVFESILGESQSAGLLELESKDIDLAAGIDSEMSDEEFMKMLKAHTRDIPMSKFLSGDKLREVKEDKEDYQVIYEGKKGTRGAKPKSKLSRDKLEALSFDAKL